MILVRDSGLGVPTANKAVTWRLIREGNFSEVSDAERESPDRQLRDNYGYYGTPTALPGRVPQLRPSMTSSVLMEVSAVEVREEKNLCSTLRTLFYSEGPKPVAYFSLVLLALGAGVSLFLFPSLEDDRCLQLCVESSPPRLDSCQAIFNPLPHCAG